MAEIDEVFADYDSYLHTDAWPSTSGREEWIGDMAPQHAAAAIYKLKRWAVGQWSDEMRGEAEWAKVKASRMYRHLAARATANDFVMDDTPAVINVLPAPDARALSVQQASVVVLYTLIDSEAVRRSGLINDMKDSSELGNVCFEIARLLYERGYTLQKVDS